MVGMADTPGMEPERRQGARDELEERIEERAARSAFEQAREGEQQFRTLADAIPQLVWMAEPDGFIYWYNRRWYEYTGTTPEQMEGWGWQSVHDPEVLPEVLERWRASITSGEPFDMVFPLRGADGVFRRFLTRVEPVKDGEGRVVRWFGTNTDVDELKRIEEALRESEERYRMLFANMIDGYQYCEIVLDDEGRPVDFVYLDVNASFERLTGLRDVVGKRVSDVIPGIRVSNPELFEIYGRAALEGVSARFETEVPELDRVFDVSVYGVGSPRFVTVFDNITERKRAEEARERLASLTQERARIDRSMAEINSDLASSLDVDSTLPRVLEKTSLELGALGADMLERIEGGWRVTHVHGLASAVIVPGAVFWDDQVPRAANALEMRQPFVVNDVSTTEGVSLELAERSGYRAYAAYPLVARNQVSGLLTVFFSGPRSLSADELDYLRRVAFAVSLAEENSRLYSAEHDISDRLQTALLALPDEVRGIEFAHAYHSATETARVGGDFYDLFEIDDGHVGVVIGDVAGKGIDAAVLTSMVKNTIRAHANERGKTPKEILTLTNNVIYKATSTESFVTVFFGMLDCRDGRLVYGNAGHTTSVILGVDGSVGKLSVTAPLLGAFQDVEFDEAETCLQLDQLLFLYTDGLTEARDDDDELYGEERVFAKLSATKDGRPAEVVNEMLADVLAFTGDRLSDDMALLAVRRVEQGAGTPREEKLEM